MSRNAQFTIQTKGTATGQPEIIIEVPFDDTTRIFGLNKQHAKEWIQSLSEAIGHIENYDAAVDALRDAQTGKQ